jgi:hypothetical protein
MVNVTDKQHLVFMSLDMAGTKDTLGIGATCTATRL